MIERLDKFLADAGLGTRTEVKKFIAKGFVRVDNDIVKESSFKTDFLTHKVFFNDEEITPKRTVVCVLNKPAGYVTSTDDPFCRTVMELVPEEYVKLGVKPVGRLDKDTEGVLLFTNDGDLLHRLISPKSIVAKSYYAKFEGRCPENAEELFADGIVLKDGSKCRSSVFEKLSSSECIITLTEGMYHQVKRMMGACGMHVTYLRRDCFAGVCCDEMEIGSFEEIKNFDYEV